MGDINLSVIVLVTLLVLLLLMVAIIAIFKSYDKKKCELDCLINVEDRDFALKILSLKHKFEKIVNGLSKKYVGKMSKIDELQFEKDFETMMIKLERSVYEFFLENPEIDKLKTCEVLKAFTNTVYGHFYVHLYDVMSSESMSCRIYNIVIDTMDCIFKYVINSDKKTVITEVNKKEEQNSIRL